MASELELLIEYAHVNMYFSSELLFAIVGSALLFV